MHDVYDVGRVGGVGGVSGVGGVGVVGGVVAADSGVVDVCYWLLWPTGLKKHNRQFRVWYLGSNLLMSYPAGLTVMSPSQAPLNYALSDQRWK